MYNLIPFELLKKNDDPAYRDDVACIKQIIYVFMMIPPNAFSICLVIFNKEMPIDKSSWPLDSFSLLGPCSTELIEVSRSSICRSTLEDEGSFAAVHGDAR